MKSPFRCCFPCSDVDVVEPFVPPPDLESEPDPESPSPAPDLESESDPEPLSPAPDLESESDPESPSPAPDLESESDPEPLSPAPDLESESDPESPSPAPDLESESDPESPSPAPDLDQSLIPNHRHLLQITPASSRLMSFKSLYNVGEMLGSGGFGRVFEGTRKFDGKKVAIKQMLKIDNDRYLHIEASGVNVIDK
ncbi:diacylglycerol kinase kappa-like [Chanodichthys erythropterus]|uniref:diacylglycerol kinase kappa-like n=1 Tax=Chanodichthys erythropterus TaxID=933992 RepID=UPI00351E6E64